MGREASDPEKNPKDTTPNTLDCPRNSDEGTNIFFEGNDGYKSIN